jgi:hypothetical protein
MLDNDFAIDEPITHEPEIDDSAFLEGFNEDLPKQPEMTLEPVQTEVIQEVDQKSVFVDEMAAQYGMEPEEFIKSVQEEQQELELYNMMAQGVDEDTAREVLEVRQYKVSLQQEEQAKEQRENQMFGEFFNTFKEVTGRDWHPDKDVISQKVWNDVAQGKSLKDAYATHDEEYLFLKGFNEL